VLNYKISINAGLTINNWSQVDVIASTSQPSKLVDNLIPGGDYLFTVSAENI